MLENDTHFAAQEAHIEVEHLSATDDDVAFAYTLTGTNKGLLQGNDATGKKIKVRGVQNGRFEDGKLVERWISSDPVGISTQLGDVAA